MKTVLFVCFSVATTISQGETLAIRGGLFSLGFTGLDAEILPDGSIIQLGYFLGIGTSTLPSNFGQTDWQSFTPILGVGSPNEGDQDLFIDYGTGEFDTIANVPPSFFSELPTRLGIRVFDSTTTISGHTYYNTLSSDDDRWIIESLPPVPTPEIGSADLTITPSNQDLVFFEDNSNPFRTTVQLPEPGVTLSLITAMAFLLPLRHRSLDF